MTQRIDNFLIWGHGLTYRDEILEMIRARPEFDILRMVAHRPRHLHRFIRDVYRYDVVPYRHLRDKTRYLMTTDPQVLAIFVHNRRPREVPFGERPFSRRACMLVKQVKEEIRDRFNPRVNGCRSEDHVIHGSDHPQQVDHLLRILGFADGLETLTRSASRVVGSPAHLPALREFHIRYVNGADVRCCVLQGRPDEKTRILTPIQETPHFRFLQGDREPYTAYWTRYRESRLTNDHSPEAFDRLAQNFNYLKAPHHDRYIIVAPDPHEGLVILDGVHRAAVLQHQEQTRWLAVITK